MIEKILKRITKFYQISLVLIMGLTIAIVFYFWNLGFIDGSKGKELHQASFIMESFSDKNKFVEVKDLIYLENPKQAIEKVKLFQSELEKIDKHVSVDEFKDLRASLQDLKTKSAELIAFTKSDKIVSVFTQKLSKFYHYVKKNNWRTLTRMSDRVYTKISGHLNPEKFGSLAKNILRDFNAMTRITENSILSRQNKSEIVSRITNLQTEMNMLNDYAEQREQFDEIYVKNNKNLKSWLDKVSPEITLGKIGVEEVGRYYVIGMLSILFILSCLFIASFVVNKWFLKKTRDDLENGIETFLNDGIIAGDQTLFDEFSKDFQRFTQRTSQYIDKRMSFGSIFQDALPLASILLDDNLKVIWANKQFCDDWKISNDEIQKDYMSWDYLNKLTNLGTDDPILEALKHNIAGIYQVQVKPDDHSEVKPYEMFVSPIKNKNENKIMLFFYDLTNLEETIKDQSKSILGPVKRSVEALMQGEFVASEQMEHEFKIAGIEEIYEKFMTLNEDLIKSENELISEVETAESKIKILKEHIDTINHHNEDNLKLSRINVEALKCFKDNVISLSELSRQLDQITIKSGELINTNINALRNSSQKVTGLKQITSELVEAMPRFYNVKEEIKNARGTISENRSKLSHELSQVTIHIKRTEDTQTKNKLQRTIAKVNDSFSLLDGAGDELDKKLSQLDVLLSKAQMIMNSAQERVHGINADYEKTQIDYSEHQASVIAKNAGGKSSRIEKYEEEIVNSLQQIFKANKDNIKICDSISGIQAKASTIADQSQLLN